MKDSKSDFFLDQNAVGDISQYNLTIINSFDYDLKGFFVQSVVTLIVFTVVFIYMSHSFFSNLNLSFKLVLSIFELLIIISCVIHGCYALAGRPKDQNEDMHLWHNAFTFINIFEEIMGLVFILILYKVLYLFKRVYYQISPKYNRVEDVMRQLN